MRVPARMRGECRAEGQQQRGGRLPVAASQVRKNATHVVLLGGVMVVLSSIALRWLVGWAKAHHGACDSGVPSSAFAHAVSLRRLTVGKVAQDRCTMAP